MYSLIIYLRVVRRQTCSHLAALNFLGSAEYLNDNVPYFNGSRWMQLMQNVGKR